MCFDTSWRHNERRTPTRHFLTMTTSTLAIVPQEIQHAALVHEIHVAPSRIELHQSHKKSASLDTYRAELLSKVHDHLDEIHHLEDTMNRTAKFKDELLAKVHSH